MRTHLVSGLVFTCFAALGAFGGCVVDVDPQTGDEVGIAQSEATTTHEFGKWYTLHRCVSPYCYGYFLKEVNTRATVSHAARLSYWGLDPSVVEDVQGAPMGDVMVRGKFAEGTSNRFIVTAAYRGLPGVDALKGDRFYRTPDRNPPIACFTAPCNNIVAISLNSAEAKPFTRLSLTNALKPHVDKAWIEGLIREHGGLVTGHFREGDQYTGGKELVLEVSQVFLRLPVTKPTCMAPLPVCGGGMHPTYTRDADRCLDFDTCVEKTACVLFAPPVCEEGYVRQSWAVDNSRCYAYACDPEFTMRTR